MFLGGQDIENNELEEMLEHGDVGVFNKQMVSFTILNNCLSQSKFTK